MVWRIQISEKLRYIFSSFCGRNEIVDKWYSIDILHILWYVFRHFSIGIKVWSCVAKTYVTWHAWLDFATMDLDARWRSMHMSSWLSYFGCPICYLRGNVRYIYNIWSFIISSSAGEKIGRTMCWHGTSHNRTHNGIMRDADQIL